MAAAAAVDDVPSVYGGIDEVVKSLMPRCGWDMDSNPCMRCCKRQFCYLCNREMSACQQYKSIKLAYVKLSMLNTFRGGKFLTHPGYTSPDPELVRSSIGFSGYGYESHHLGGGIDRIVVNIEYILTMTPSLERVHLLCFTHDAWHSAGYLTRIPKIDKPHPVTSLPFAAFSVSRSAENPAQFVYTRVDIEPINFDFTAVY